MGTNFYFRNFDSPAEQTLVENLVVEAIKIYGIDCQYITRKVVTRDNLLNDDDYSKFDNAYGVEFYVKNVEGFQGQGDFLSKFGLEIRDTMTLTVSRRSFKDEITSKRSEIVRPREGDLIFFPLNRQVFEIKFVEHESVFYQMGALQTFDLSCELFEYSNEDFDTGFQEVDLMFKLLDRSMANNIPRNITTIAAGGELVIGLDGAPIVFDIPVLDEDTGAISANNNEFQAVGNNVLDFTESDPFSEGGRW